MVHRRTEARIASSSAPAARSIRSRSRSIATRMSEFSVIREPADPLARFRRRAWIVRAACWSSRIRVSFRTNLKNRGPSSGCVGTSTGLVGAARVAGGWSAGAGTAGRDVGPASPTLPSRSPRFVRAISHVPAPRWPRWTSALARQRGSHRSPSSSAGSPGTRSPRHLRSVHQRGPCSDESPARSEAASANP